MGRLKAYEEIIYKEDEKLDEQGQGKLMYVNTDTQSQQQNQDRYKSGRGRGIGGRYTYRGRGQGRYEYNGYNGGYYRQEKDTSKVVCFRCDKHDIMLSCPDILLKLQETYEIEEDTKQEDDELMMHEVVFLNEKNITPSKFETNSAGDNMWYLDNGVSNHMTENLSYFSKLDEIIMGNVRFDDDSHIDIKGKGSMLFITKNGERNILTDVYFIHDLKSSTISLGQATEARCEI